MITTFSRAISRLAFLFVVLPTLSLAKPWKSAEIITQQNFKYGAFEARIRGAEGSGMITAFFLYKNGSEWAGAEWQEQDFELFGKNGGFQTQVMTPGEPRVEHVENHVGQTPVWDRYYTYRMEWTPTALSFFVDGKLVRRETDAVTYAKILDPARAEPMNLRISLWAGDIPWSGSFDSTKVPAAVDVNWAQVYSYTPGTGPGGSDFSLLWKDDFDRIDNSRWYLANWTFDYAVNDYAPGGARASNGYLQLKMTHWSEEGTRFTPSPLDDGLLKPPADIVPPPPTGTFTTYEHLDRRYVLPSSLPGMLPTRYSEGTPDNIGQSSCGVGALDLYSSLNGGCFVGGITENEWLEFSVSTLESADWDLRARVAAGVEGASFRILVDGVPYGDPVSMPLGSWQSFQNLLLGSLPLSAGDHLVRIEFLSSGLNFENLELVRAGSESAPEASFITGPVLLPGAILAKNFARGTDLTAGNIGGHCRGDDVDLELSLDLYEDCNIGWTEATEWIEYDVHSFAAASYDLSLRLASAIADRSVQISVNGLDVGTPVVSPSAGWASFATVDGGRLSLPAGPSRIRLTFLQGDVNFHWLRLDKVAAAVEAPSVVTGLTAVPGEARIALSWSASTNAVRYAVERSTDGGLTYAVVQTTTALSWTDTDVLPGLETRYRVVAKGASTDAVASVVVVATALEVPVAGIPQGLTAVAGDRQVVLSWLPTPNATGYILLRGVVGGTLAEIARPTTTTFTDVGLTNGTGYAYQLRAFRGLQVSDPTASVVATPVGLPPAAVASLSAMAGNANVVLTWPAAARATGYSIQRAVGTGAFAAVSAVSTTTWTDLNVVNGTSYRYRVLATNVDGIAAASPIVTAVPKLPPPSSASVRVEYQAGATGATNGIRPLLRLVNTGTTALNLSTVKIRYWFTRDGATSNNYWCDWAQIGSSNIQGTFQNLATPRTNADTYLEIGFKTTAGSLAAGASTGEIQSRFSKSDWSSYNQANDASYDATASAYKTSTRVTVYVNGVLVSGTEP